MTMPLDFSHIEVEDADPPQRSVPNHRASPDYEPSIEDKPKRPGVFGGRTRKSTQDTMESRNVKAKSRKVVPNKPGQFVTRLEEMYTGLGMVLMPFKPAAAAYLTLPSQTMDEETRTIVEGPTGARKCAVAWDEAAQRNETVRNMLDTFLSVGVWGTLLAVHAPLLLAIAQDTPADPSVLIGRLFHREPSE